MFARLFDRSLLRPAFTDLRERAFAEGKKIEATVYGGSALGPAAFRRRLLFVSHDALSRPRLHQT